MGLGRRFLCHRSGIQRILHHATVPPGQHYTCNTVTSILALTYARSFLFYTYQALQIVWFGMIIRVATRVATGKGGASDVRSDAEDRQVSFTPDAIISI